MIVQMNKNNEKNLFSKEVYKQIALACCNEYSEVKSLLLCTWRNKLKQLALSEKDSQVT